MMQTQPRRVVVTGLGAVTPIGLDVPAFWDALLRGVSGAAPITAFDPCGFSTTFACELKGWDPLDHMDGKRAARLDPFARYAMVAAGEAVRDARLRPERLSVEARERVGVVFGSEHGGLQMVQDQARAFMQGGPRRLSPYFIPMTLHNVSAGNIAIEHGFQGPAHAVVSACASGNDNLAAALQMIRAGVADVVVAGASEAPICQLGIGGFGALRALSTRNDAPAAASRPGDAARDGFVMGEGAGALVLEALEHAEDRGARIYAELLAVGAAADAYHVTAPHPEARGTTLALERALRQAGVTPDQVDTINLHGTSTVAGDAAEARAVRAVFGGHADRLAVTSTKSMTGHLLGAASAIEAVATVLSLVHQVVPPTINHDVPDPACNLRYAANTPDHRPLRIALNNAFGFGGSNSAAVFRAWPAGG